MGMKQARSIFHWVKLWAYFCTVLLPPLVVSCSYLYTENAPGNFTLTLCRNKAKTKSVQTKQSFCTKTCKRKVSSVHSSKFSTTDLFEYSKDLSLRIGADKARLILMLIIFKKKSPLIPHDVSTTSTSPLSSPPSSSSTALPLPIFLFSCIVCGFFLTGVSINQQTDSVFLPLH